MLRNITAGSMSSAAWPKDLLESLLATILRAERAMPDHAQLLMGAIRDMQKIENVSRFGCLSGQEYLGRIEGG